MLTLILSHIELTVSNPDRVLAAHQAIQQPFFLHCNHVVQLTVEVLGILATLKEEHAYVQIQGHVCFDLLHDEPVASCFPYKRILSDKMNTGYFTLPVQNTVLDH